MEWLILALVVLIAFVIMLIVFVMSLSARVKRIKSESEAEKMTDSETGMGNLQFFKYHFNNKIGEFARNFYYIAYIILDSSYLKTYYKDSSFDDVIKYTAYVLSENTYYEEISARISESGFALAFHAINEEDARKRINDIVNKLNDFDDKKAKNKKPVFHCATYHLLSTDKNCEIILFNLRKNCNKIFGTEKQIIYCDERSMNVIQEERQISERILRGLKNDEFKLYLQFIVDNQTKKIVCAEGLSRWHTREKGVVGPFQYIEDMQTAGLITNHDFYILECACRQLEKWKDTDYNGITISCNFTRITLSEEDFADKITEIVNKYDFDKSKLAIEITEDAIEKDMEIARQNVYKCKELGMKVYLDDLGSGYTSLTNLCDYPIDVVKIDRDILLNTNTPKGKALFKGIVALAHSLGNKVTCEGVENEEQNEFVSSTDCDYIQGWYYTKALPLCDCEEFIDKYTKKPKA